MADHHVTDIEAPASADERVEEFAEFLDQLEDYKDLSASADGKELAAANPSDAADAEQAREPDTDQNSDDPAIAPPVSWDSDAKALFEQLPPELQEKVAAREAQRERAVQSATSAAAEARRNAAAEASALFADQQRLYAQHLEQVAGRQRPDGRAAGEGGYRADVLRHDAGQAGVAACERGVEGRCRSDRVSGGWR
jgi:hypothetical protein